MPPRRAHKKSRAGCKRCKARKIKCDEVHPRCGNCTKHAVQCDFETGDVIIDGLVSPVPGTPSSLAPTTPAGSVGTPASTAPSSGPAPSAARRSMELRLVHHWSTKTSKTLAVTGPATEQIWRDAVPLLAFSGAPYLTDTLLAISALHLRSESPDDPDLTQASHLYMASSLALYCAELKRGITKDNAEALFLTSALIAFQSSASRLFVRENEPGPEGASPAEGKESSYAVPVSYFHSFQGVKTIVASAWNWLRTSSIVLPIINSQPVLQLDFNSDKTFFGHLLDDVEDEVAARPGHDAAQDESQGQNAGTGAGTSQSGSATPEDGASSLQAYQHAVAFLNWAHKIPHRGAPLAFPATVSRRFVQLVEERRPRALVILACFFALLKSMDEVWWLHGVARREVMSISALFEEVDPWRSKLEWPVRMVLHESSRIPPDIWGADWAKEEHALLQRTKADGTGCGGTESFATHIEMLSSMASAMQYLPSTKAT